MQPRLALLVSLLGRISPTPVLTLLIAVGINDRPALAPQEGAFEKIVYVTANPTFAQASSVIGGIMFTLAGTPALYVLKDSCADN